MKTGFVEDFIFYQSTGFFALATRDGNHHQRRPYSLFPNHQEENGRGEDKQKGEGQRGENERRQVKDELMDSRFQGVKS